MAVFLGESQADRPMSAIDLTPMIGVLSALLVLFILTVPVTQELPLPIAPDERFGEALGPAPVEIALATDGAIHWNGTVIDRVEFERQIEFEAGASIPPIFHVRSESKVKYQELATLLAALQRRHLHFSLGNK